MTISAKPKYISIIFLLNLSKQNDWIKISKINYYGSKIKKLYNLSTSFEFKYHSSNVTCTKKQLK